MKNYVKKDLEPMDTWSGPDHSKDLEIADPKMGSGSKDEKEYTPIGIIVDKSNATKEMYLPPPYKDDSPVYKRNRDKSTSFYPKHKMKKRTILSLLLRKLFESPRP